MARNQVQEAGENRLNFTATSTLGGNGGYLIGIAVASASTGTIKVADDAGTIQNTTSVAAGQFYPMPVRFVGTLTITVGGTLDATVFYS
jgi:hypothetical protein